MVGVLKVIELIPVQSSMIASVGYDARTRVMVVLYNNGKAYEYHGVPPEIYWGLMTSDSKGQFMNREILGFFPFKPFRGWQRLNEDDLYFGRWMSPRRMVR